MQTKNLSASVIMCSGVTIFIDEHAQFKLALMRRFELDEHHVLVEIRRDDNGNIGPHVRLLSLNKERYPDFEAGIAEDHKVMVSRLNHRLDCLHHYEHKMRGFFERHSIKR